MRLIDISKLNAMDLWGEDGDCHVVYDYDEIHNAPTVEAIPKADYENRLNADMLSMLYKLRSEIINMPKYFPYADHTRWFIDGDVFVGLIDNKINELKGDQEGEE